MGTIQKQLNNISFLSDTKRIEELEEEIVRLKQYKLIAKKYKQVYLELIIDSKCRELDLLKQNNYELNYIQLEYLHNLAILQKEKHFSK